MEAGRSARDVDGANCRAFSLLLLLLVGTPARDELCRVVVDTDPVFQRAWLSMCIGNVAIYSISLS